MIDGALTFLAVLLMVAVVRAAWAICRLLWPRRHWPRRSASAPSLEHQIGTVIATGMDRVDQLRYAGADAFQTLMPMPNGECWSVMVRRFPDEPSARVALHRRAD